MPRPDDILPGLGQKTLVPKLRAGASLAQLTLSEGEGYVLSRVDGQTTLWEICLLVPLRREETLRMLRRLRQTGIIEIPGSTEPMPEPEARTGAGTAAGARHPQAPPSGPAPPGQAPTAAPVPVHDPGTSPTMARSAAPATPPAPAPPAAPVSSAQKPPPKAPASAPSPSAHAPGPHLEASLLAYIESIPEDLARAPTPPPRSATSPDLSDLSLFRAQEPHPEVEVEVIRSTNSSRPLFLDDVRPQTSRQSSRPGSPSTPPIQRTPSHTSRPQASPHQTPSHGSRQMQIQTHTQTQTQTRHSGASAQAAPVAARHSEADSARHGDPHNESACDLTPEQRKRVDGVYRQLGAADAFTLLGVTMDADKKAVQRAYFKLSKEFHPDRFFKKELGPYRQRIAAVFQALTESRDILVDEERRRAYLSGQSM